jgi:hypothetical protein
VVPGVPPRAFTGCPFGARGPMRPLGHPSCGRPCRNAAHGESPGWSEAEPWVSPPHDTPPQRGERCLRAPYSVCPFRARFRSGTVVPGRCPGCLETPRWCWMRDSAAPLGLTPSPTRNPALTRWATFCRCSAPRHRRGLHVHHRAILFASSRLRVRPLGDRQMRLAARINRTRQEALFGGASTRLTAADA